MLPGVCKTDLLVKDFDEFAKDDPALTGMMALWLVQPKADYLKGQLASINWDLEEMEAHKKEIEEHKLLQIKWIPLLPASGGQGWA